MPVHWCDDAHGRLSAIKFRLPPELAEVGVGLYSELVTRDMRSHVPKRDENVTRKNLGASVATSEKLHD